MRNPTGDKKSPGKTCRDIAAAADTPLKNGNYWIDPNGGGVSDAIEVFCRFNAETIDKTQTCLEPATTEFEKAAWFSTRPATNEHVLFAETFAEEEFSYNAHRSQIKYLQHLHSRARQVVTINCKNMVAVYDNSNKTANHAVKLISFDEEELGIHSAKAFRYRVLEDGCKDRSGKWNKAVLEVKTKGSRLKRLPILDVGLKDVAGSGQKFGIELSRACFSRL